jgi:hypothetical protein
MTAPAVVPLEGRDDSPSSLLAPWAEPELMGVFSLYEVELDAAKKVSLMVSILTGRDRWHSFE